MRRESVCLAPGGFALSPGVTTRIFTALLVFATVASAEEAKIGAIGRLRPAGGLREWHGPGLVVEAVKVAEGALVESGEILVTYRGRELAEGVLAGAERELIGADESGRRTLEMMELRLAGLDEDLALARQRRERFGKLGGDKVSPPEMEQRDQQLRSTARARAISAKELDNARQERERRVASARQQVAEARERLESFTLRAPGKFTVLKLSARPGFPPNGPVATLADLTEIHCLAEVFAADLLRVKPGQVATVSSSALPTEQKGKVVSVGRIITGRSRIGEVLIRLDAPGDAARLLDMEVNVSIQP